MSGYIRDMSEEQKDEIFKLQKTIATKIKKLAKSQERDISELLGRLKQRHKVEVSPIPLDLSYLPVNISIGDTQIDIPLEDWGSGTQNRTLILYSLIRAKRIASEAPSPSKITPFIVIEEPESFLHPTAQAQFGRLLQEISEELRIQVIVTTHSPYMMSFSEPRSNILLSRREVSRKTRETYREKTDGEKWMEPFSQALGIHRREFEPWQDLLSKPAKSVLMVEGSTDVQYLEFFRDDRHGPDRLDFDGSIYNYEGCGNIKNQAIIRFIHQVVDRCIITFDKDQEKELTGVLTSAGLKSDRNFIPIGLDSEGKQCIEGLVPDRIKRRVFHDNPELVDRIGAAGATRKTAKNQIKVKLLEALKSDGQREQGDFEEFYKLVAKLNRALRIG